MTDDVTPAARRRPKAAIGCGIVLVVSVLVVEVLLRFLPVAALSHDQLVARYHAPEQALYQPQPYLPFALTPGFRSPEGRRPQVSINEAGFRGPDVPLAKPEGELRIACFGGSSTFGAGPSSDAKTWPAQLEARLRERFPGRSIRVLNFGTPHWTTFESLACLSIRALAYEPDVVLVYHAVNDTWAGLAPDPRPDNAHTRRVWALERPHVLDRSLEWSMTYRIWRRYLSGDTLDRRDIQTYVDVDTSRLQLDPPLAEQGFENFRRNLTSMVAVATAHGARPVFVTQATRPVDENDMPLLSRERPGRNPELFAKIQRILNIMRDRSLPVVREVAAEQDVALIDARGHMEAIARQRMANGNDDRLYTDTVHLTDVGAKLFADHLAQQLIEQRIVE